MKKCIIFSIMFTLVFGSFAFFGKLTDKAWAVTSSVDQSNTTGAGNVAIYSGYGRFGQTFRPSKSKLDKVSVNLLDPAGQINCFIKKFNGSDWDIVAQIYNQNVVDSWNTYDFDDIDVTVGDRYQIQIVSNSTSPKWYYSDQNPYPNGYAIWQTQDKLDWDYQFKTYGYNPDDPNSSGQSTTDQGTSSSTSATSGQSPSSQPTASIGKPSSLTAEYKEENNSRGVKLLWKASSTADIDGYRIYRSEEEKKGFSKIFEVKKGILEYLDQSIAANKTYYYFVRAYKGSSESYSTNTANVKTPTDIGLEKPKDFKVDKVTSTTISVIWSKSTEATLAGYMLSIYKDDIKVKSVDLAKDISSYEFSGLAEGTVYKIELISKDTNNKVSPAATIIQATSQKSQMFAFTKLVGILGGITFVLIVLLIYLIIRRKESGSKVK